MVSAAVTKWRCLLPPPRTELCVRWLWLPVRGRLTPKSLLARDAQLVRVGEAVGARRCEAVERLGRRGVDPGEHDEVAGVKARVLRGDEDADRGEPRPLRGPRPRDRGGTACRDGD